MTPENSRRLNVTEDHTTSALPQDWPSPEPDKSQDFRAWMEWSEQIFRNEAQRLGLEKRQSNYKRTFLTLDEIDDPIQRVRLQRIVDLVEEPVTHPIVLWEANDKKKYSVWGDPELRYTPRMGETKAFNYGRYFIPLGLDIRSLTPEAQRISHCISSEYATPEYLMEVAEIEEIDLADAMREITSRVHVDINSSGELIYLGTEIIEYEAGEQGKTVSSEV